MRERERSSELKHKEELTCALYVTKAVVLSDKNSSRNPSLRYRGFRLDRYLCLRDSTESQPLVGLYWVVTPPITHLSHHV